MDLPLNQPEKYNDSRVKKVAGLEKFTFAFWDKQAGIKSNEEIGKIAGYHVAYMTTALPLPNLGNAKAETVV